MTYGLALVTAAPAVVSLAEAKLQLAVTHSEWDGQIAEWVRVATQQLETDTGLKLLTQTWDLVLDAFPTTGAALDLPWGPVQSVTSVKSYDTTGTLNTLTSSNYIADTFHRPGRIGLTDTGAWPTDLRTFQPGVIRVVFGWSTVAAIPAPYLMAIKLLVGHFAMNREAVGGGQQVMPLGYEALIADRQYGAA